MRVNSILQGVVWFDRRISSMEGERRGAGRVAVQMRAHDCHINRSPVWRRYEERGEKEKKKEVIVLATFLLVRRGRCRELCTRKRRRLPAPGVNARSSSFKAATFDYLEPIRRFAIPWALNARVNHSSLTLILK